MAISSKIQFGVKDTTNGKWQVSNEYNVVDCHLHFMRHYNHFRPDTDARCEKVEMVVEAPGKNDLTLVDWYINNEAFDGRIIFDLPSKTSESSMEKLVVFMGARCYSFEEQYHINIQRRRYYRLSIVAEEITVNDIAFKNLYASDQA